MPTFFVSQGMSVTHSLRFNAAMMGGYVAGPFLCAFIADRVGRRWGVALAAVYRCFAANAAGERQFSALCGRCSL